MERTSRGIDLEREALTRAEWGEQPDRGFRMYGETEKTKAAERRKPEGQRKSGMGAGLENSHRKRMSINLIEYRNMKQVAPE